MVNKKGFSLIELSIVLIIIGLLVAGVTGGASLINSAKTQALINEMQNYRQAVYVFRSLNNNRLPGDVNNSNKIGLDSGQNYTINDFESPYNNTIYALPNFYTAPFVELYLENIIDFQPINTENCSSSSKCASLGGIPYSKTYKNYIFYYEYINSVSHASKKNILNKNVLTFYNHEGNFKVDPKILMSIDRKIDDSEIIKGKFISYYPNTTNYQENIDNGNLCQASYYLL